MKKQILAGITVGIFILLASSCGPEKGKKTMSFSSDAASKVYVPPGQYDEFYAFLSGGFSGHVAVYGLPSGRLFKEIPVFSESPEEGYGYTEETKPMLMTSYGFIPWDDAHHPEFSMTDGDADGRWLFINGNNTPRVARLDLTTFTTSEIIEIPNSAGNHASPFVTENTEYIITGTRFSLPVGRKNVPISSYKDNFNGVISLVSVDKDKGTMSLAFQIIAPPFDYDLSHAGKGPSHDWIFLTCYNSEEAHTLLEANASQNDKDFIVAINWKKAEEYAKTKTKTMNTPYYHNTMDESKHSAVSEVINSEKMLDPADCPGMMYFMPCPKSPHGCDVDPSGEYIVGSGKLAAQITVFSFSKMLKAIEDKKFDGESHGIPIINYDAALAGEVKNPGLGPLHTEFDGKGYGYTSMFISSEIVKWKIGTWQVVDRIPTYYSIGHLLIPGGDTRHPFGKYMVALNKICKDRYLPTGPELCQPGQLIDISGDKMKLLLDFPLIGEPHYAQAIPAEKLMKKSLKIYDLNGNTNPYAVKSEGETKVVKEGKTIHACISMIRSHFNPDNIEGINLGDTVYFHVTNLEQDWDEPHGFAVMGNNNSEMLIMPGETQTLKWVPGRTGMFPFYCTDFCSALHQEMQGYLRVSDRSENVPLTFGLNK